MAQRRTFRVLGEHEGLRLDQAIAAHLPDVSRVTARRALREGGVFVDRKRVKIAGRAVRAGQLVEIYVSTPQHRENLDAETPSLLVVHETKDYVVVDKPSGLFSAPTPASDQQDVLADLRRRADDAKAEFFLVHRLDRPTSGLMVVAKNKAAAAHLSEQVASRRMKRRYEAFLFGVMQDSTTVEATIDSKEAITDFVPLGSRGPFTWVSAELRTGRTHQVRIHATEFGAPIVGDSKYGRQMLRNAPSRAPRLCLHAAELSFLDPSSQELVRFSSPLPPELLDFWQRLPGPA